MKNYAILAAALLAFASLPASALPLSFPECPAVGHDTTGCELLITVTAVTAQGNAAAFTVTTSSPDLGPFDGSHDTLIGVLNAAPVSVSRIFFMIGGAPETFAGADRTGACFGSGTTPLYSPAPTPDQCLNGHYWTTDLMDYASLGVTFIPSGVIVGEPSGVLPPGGTTWFSLPQALTASEITIATPEPASLFLIGAGITALYCKRRRKA